MSIIAPLKLNPFLFPPTDSRSTDLRSHHPILLTNKDRQFITIAAQHPTTFYWHHKTRLGPDKIRVREYKYVTVIGADVHTGVYLDPVEGLWVAVPEKVFVWDGQEQWSEVEEEGKGVMEHAVVVVGALTTFPPVGTEWI